MKVFRYLLLCGLVVFLTSGCFISKKVHTQLLSEKSALEVDYEKLERELRDVRKDFTDTSKELADARKEIAETTKLLADMRAEKDQKIAEQSNRIQTLDREIADLKAKNVEDLEVVKEKQVELSKSLQVLQDQSSEESKILLAQLEELRDKYDKDMKNKNNEIASLKSEHRSTIEELNNRIFQEAQSSTVIIEKLRNKVNDLEALTSDQKRAMENLSSQADELEQQLKTEIEKGEITLKRYKTKTIINIDNSICFDSGSSVLKKDVKKSLAKIADTLKIFPDNNIQIEGHTDDVPIQTKRFPSNWELSSARALAVLRYLETRQVLDPGRLSAVGYGEYHPIAPNDTPGNKRLNRRVDIVILPK